MFPKRGTRIEALEPLRMGVKEQFGSVAKDAARGLVPRMDHGCQRLADHFQNEIRFLGIAPSLAFIGEPQTCGVAERFIRTLRELAIHGRIFNTVEDVRRVVREFVETCNRQWRVEKRGFMTPSEARSACLTRLAE